MEIHTRPSGYTGKVDRLGVITADTHGTEESVVNLRTIRMKHFRYKFHLRGTKGVVCGENELCDKDTTLKWAVFRTPTGGVYTADGAVLCSD